MYILNALELKTLQNGFQNSLKKDMHTVKSITNCDVLLFS